VHVIERKLGIPVSLACVYILVGGRLGLDITGCNLPGHFLARVRADGGEFFVDCFNGGRVLEKESILQANPAGAVTIRAILENAISAETIVIRALNNLARAFERGKDTANRDLMIELCRAVEVHERGGREGGDAAGGGLEGFSVGDLVKHRRYGYRGVVVARDGTCRADDAWYQANVTRPDRNQRWYSVLVDGSEQVTYAAESSLAPDDTGAPVHHRLVPKFFDAFIDGTYRRNDRRWPGWAEPR
jgi:hemimethylated DNA binding protein